MATLSMALILMFSAVSAGADGPKYVFFFLGDGMASAQIQATEAYLTTFNGGSAAVAEDLLKSENRLNMSKMPVQGMQTTYDSFALMTDSASSATAFACGLKTKSGVIGMDNSMTASYKSVAQLAFEGGKKVGVISSVSLDHATPAAYYASVANRGLMNNIATQLANTGYDFFGGGGLASPSGPARSGDTANDVWGLLATNGYTVLKTRDDILALKSAPKNKVVCINPWLQDSAAMPYDIDRPATNLSLAEMTEVAIACLKDEKPGRGKGHPRDGGFFLMVEGGKIDWACHANDAMATIGDMLDFDNAVGVALGFYKRYPQQTLIIVTGDHETGGMSVGHATTSAFGLDYNSLNDYQKEKLEDAYDKSMSGTNDNSKPENDLLYGGYEAIVVTITHILNQRASIGWTSYSHTGVPVPVFAQGSQAKRFAGFYDNTDIAKQLAKAMGINEELPIAK
ncbi:MAG: alkaline phosphatase [Desulfatitalea sp.]|nr:alkaline phosphatase [Desulfatitalea sp.]